MARLEKIQAQTDTKEYNKMVKNVDVSVRGCMLTGLIVPLSVLKYIPILIDSLQYYQLLVPYKYRSIHHLIS